MFISTCFCDFKCCREAGLDIGVCQNAPLVQNNSIVDISDDTICKHFIDNPITKAIVIGGLEPFEQFTEVLELISKLRNEHNCDKTVVIYTGFNKTEILPQIEALKPLKNIIVKFGRFVPNQKRHFDKVLGVYLASPNQYAEVIC